jgi:hypothetical protein
MVRLPFSLPRSHEGSPHTASCGWPHHYSPAVLSVFLKAEIVRQSSGSANSTRMELISRKFKDAATIENFETHLTFYRSKNAIFISVGAGFDDAFLAWVLLNSLSLEDPIWSMTSINIVTSGISINRWLFNVVAGKLREALRNNIRPTETQPLVATSRL